MNEIRLTFDKIFLSLSDPRDWVIAENLAGSVKSDRLGVYQYSLSPLNLQRIYAAFPGQKRPVVKDGSFFMDRERERFQKYQKHVQRTQEILALERLPTEPNGKFVPYAHQTKIVGGCEVNPYLPVFADCGLGKTGSLARAIEIGLEVGEVVRGKILISAPLSILDTSWGDDIKKFTNLKACILWSDISNKDILGDEVVLFDYGPKPEDTVSVKTRAKIFHKSERTGQFVEEVTTLDKPNGPWTRFKAKVKVSTNLSGESKPFGEVRAKPATREATKLMRVQQLLADPQYDLYLINHDGVKQYQDILKEHRFAWVVVDESTEIKSAKSKSWEAHVDISWKCKRRNILTGTPNPNGFIDLWAQFYFLDRGLTLESSLKDYLKEYFTPVRMGNFVVRGKDGSKDAVKWVIRSPQDRERLITRVRKAGIFLKQRDCIDMPPRTDMVRSVRLSGAQERAYMEMEERLITELRVGTDVVRAEAVNILAKMMKLRQFTSGYAVGEDDRKVIFSPNPKLDDLDQFIENLGDQKLVIVCQFKQEIYTLLKRYEGQGVAAIFGDVPVSDRTESIRSFQTEDKIKFMILQPQAAAHGITLTASSHMFFLSLDYNFEYYYQTAKRIERLGQKSPIFVNHSLAVLSDGSETIDHDLMDIVGSKGKEHALLFAPLRNPADIVSAIADRMIKRVESRL